MNNLTILKTKNNEGKPCFVAVFDEAFCEKFQKENEAVEAFRKTLKDLKNGQMTFHDLKVVDNIELGDENFVVETEISDFVKG